MICKYCRRNHLIIDQTCLESCYPSDLQTEIDRLHADREKLVGLLEEARQRFIDYEMDIDDVPPYPQRHRDFMKRLKIRLRKDRERLWVEAFTEGWEASSKYMLHDYTFSYKNETLEDEARRRWKEREKK
jgi:hypothetical protein